MECAHGVAQAFSRFLAEETGPQNILLLQRHSAMRWRCSCAVSRCRAMLIYARHRKSTTATNLASCLATLTRAAGAPNGAETILAVRDLSGRIPSVKTVFRTVKKTFRAHKKAAAKASRFQQWKYNYHLARTTDINEDAASTTTARLDGAARKALARA